MGGASGREDRGGRGPKIRHKNAEHQGNGRVVVTCVMNLAQDLTVSLHLCLTFSLLHPMPLGLDQYQEYPNRCLYFWYLRYVYSGTSILTICFLPAVSFAGSRGFPASCDLGSLNSTINPHPFTLHRSSFGTNATRPPLFDSVIWYATLLQSSHTTELHPLL